MDGAVFWATWPGAVIHLRRACCRGPTSGSKTEILEPPPRPSAGLINREPDARRAAVDRLDAGQPRFHGAAPVMEPPIRGSGWELVVTPCHEGHSATSQCVDQPMLQLSPLVFGLFEVM